MANDHIVNFLDYYLNLKEAPEYAVLLKGRWGAGKTWFVKKYLESRSTKFLWASFNGISSFREIEDQFFEQLHPRLASKEMKLAGKILKGVLKATVKIDWDGDGKEDASATIQSPDLKGSDLINTEKYVIVFDDLERSQMTIEKVLGYINQYVEIVGQKVICICNEDDIIEKDDRYLKIREKVAGKIYEVKPDLKSVLTDFLNHEDLKKSQIDFSLHEERILNIFKSSESNNLRILKQALLEFDRLFSGLDDKIQEKNSLIEHLLSVFLIFFIEVHRGSLKASEIQSLTNSGFFYLTDKSPEIKKTTYNRYNLSSLNNSLLPDTYWESILGEGFVSLEQISHSLRNSAYFEDDKTPLWRKIWRITDLGDDQFSEYFKQLELRIKTDDIESWGEVVHIAGIYLTLHKMGLGTKTPKEVIQWAKSYIDKLRQNGKLFEENADKFSIRDREFWGGAQFRNHKSKEMINLIEYYEEQKLKAEEDKLKNIEAEVLKQYEENTVEFLKSISIGYNNAANYYDVPVFTFIDEKNFFDVFNKLSTDLQNQTFWFLDDRYKKNVPGALDKLRSEKGFLSKLSKIFLTEEKKLSGKVSGVRFKDFRTIYLKAYIKLLSEINQTDKPVVAKVKPTLAKKRVDKK